MKNNEIIQLTIQVGKCSLPSLPYLEYSLTARFSKEISAATTFKNKQNDTCVDFSTKLFLRMERSVFQAFQSCGVIVTGISEKGARVQIAKGTAKACDSGVQTVLIKMAKGGGELSVQMQFKSTPWEMKQPKNINSRLSAFRFHISQKQSSLQSKQQSLKISPSKLTPQKDDKLLSQIEDQQLPQSKLSNTDHINQKDYNSAEYKKQRSDEYLNKTGDSETIGLLQSKIYQYQEKLTKKIVEYQEKIQEYGSKISVYTLKMSKYEQELQERAQKQRKYQQKIDGLSLQLKDIQQKDKKLTKQFLSQKKQKKQLLLQKQELLQLLKLQNEKYLISEQHLLQLSNFMQRMINQNQNLNNVDFIEQKDEILMINDELQLEISNKNQIISEMKNQIMELKAKVHQIMHEVPKNVVIMDSLKSHQSIQSNKQLSVNINAEVNHTKKIFNGGVNKIQLQKTNKVEKKVRKVEQNKPKEVKSREVEKKVVKNEIKEKPPVNPTSKKQGRSVSAKAEIGIAIKSPKPSTKFVKNPLKLQQRNTMQTEKKSDYGCSSGYLTGQLDDLQQQNHLLINSRSSPSFIQSTTEPSKKV